LQLWFGDALKLSGYWRSGYKGAGAYGCESAVKPFAKIAQGKTAALQIASPRFDEILRERNFC